MDGLTPTSFVDYVDTFMRGYQDNLIMAAGALKPFFLMSEMGLTLTCTYPDRELEFKAYDIKEGQTAEDIISRVRMQFATCLGNCFLQLSQEADKPGEASLAKMTASIRGLITTADTPVTLEDLGKNFVNSSLEIVFLALEIKENEALPSSLTQAIQSLCQQLELDFDEVSTHIVPNDLRNACEEFMLSEHITIQEDGEILVQTAQLYLLLQSQFGIPGEFLPIVSQSVLFTHYDPSGNRQTMMYGKEHEWNYG